MARVFTGARASLKLNGVKVAFVGSVNVTQENSLTDIDVLDQLETAEHAETGHRCSFTVNLFKIDENSAAALGLDNIDINQLLNQPELTMEIFDRVSDVVRYTMSGVKFEGGSGALDARGVWNGTWNFRGRIGFGL